MKFLLIFLFVVLYLASGLVAETKIPNLCQKDLKGEFSKKNSLSISNSDARGIGFFSVTDTKINKKGNKRASIYYRIFVLGLESDVIAVTLQIGPPNKNSTAIRFIHCDQQTQEKGIYYAEGVVDLQEMEMMALRTEKMSLNIQTKVYPKGEISGFIYCDQEDHCNPKPGIGCLCY